MSGSSDFHLELGHKFQDSVEALHRATYGRSNKNGIAEFNNLVGKLLHSLLEWPRVLRVRQEPFPSDIGEGVTGAGWTFHKLEFSTPRVGGSARHGRLMFMVHKDDRLIVAIAVYTHAQFAGRIPDASLEELVLAATQSQKKPAIAEPGAASLPSPVAELAPVPLSSAAKAPDDK